MTHAQTTPSVHSSGFIVLDLLVSDGRLTPVVGGTAANVAINLALLGWQSSVTALLGDDAAGRTIRSQLDAYGVNTAGVVLDPAVETPVLIHEVGPRRHRFRFSCPECGGKYAKFRPLPPSRHASAPDADAHFFDRASSYALTVARERRDRSVIVFEPGTPGRPDATSKLAAYAHVIRVSHELKLATVAKDRAEAAQIVGMGEQGVRMRTCAEEEWHQFPSRLTGSPVDAGGAGDWLTAGMLSSLNLTEVRKGTVSTAGLAGAVSQGLGWAAACCEHLGTRGFVGGENWISLIAGRGIPLRPSQPDLVSCEIPDQTDCGFWHHAPHRS